MYKETIEPLGRRLLVSRHEAAGHSPGGLLIPTIAQEVPRRGTVLALGTELLYGLIIGDEVLLPRFGGTEVVANDQPCVIIDEVDILGKYRLEGDGVPNPPTNVE